MHLTLATSMIADAAYGGLIQALGQWELEQPVYGLDSLDEVALHPFLEKAFRKAGYGVHREQRYPADRGKPTISQGERCDFVLTPAARELVREETRGTLFDAPDAVPLDEAFWLEVKVVAQFTIDGPNPAWSSQLLSTVHKDVSKLSKDPGILHSALAIVLFVQDERVAEHDLGIWQDRCLDRNLPIAAPSRRTLPIRDRIGNALCVIAVYPVSHV